MSGTASVRPRRTPVRERVAGHPRRPPLHPYRRLNGAQFEAEVIAWLKKASVKVVGKRMRLMDA